MNCGRVASHVIPAKLVLAKAGSGNAWKWAPASAGATPFWTFISMGGPQGLYLLARVKFAVLIFAGQVCFSCGPDALNEGEITPRQLRRRHTNQCLRHPAEALR
jgi:hypothetical protein